MNNNNLTEAFRKLNHEKYDELMTGEVKHTFSREFMEKCTQVQAKPSDIKPKRSLSAKLPIFFRPGKRCLVFIAVILAMFVSVSGFCRVIYLDDYVIYIYRQQSEAYNISGKDRSESIEELYYISEEAGVTDGEVYDEWFPGAETYGIKYNYEGGELFFDQFIISGKHSVNTEFYMPEPINVDGHDGYYLKMKFDCAIIFWTTDEYCFRLYGKDDKEALIKIAGYVKAEQE